MAKQSGKNPEEPRQGLCVCVLAMGTQLCWVWGEPVSDGHGQALPVACGRTPSHLWVGDKDTTGCSAAQGSFLGDMTSCGAAGRGLSNLSYAPKQGEHAYFQKPHGTEPRGKQVQAGPYAQAAGRGVSPATGQRARAWPTPRSIRQARGPPPPAGASHRPQRCSTLLSPPRGADEMG